MEGFSLPDRRFGIGAGFGRCVWWRLRLSLSSPSIRRCFGSCLLGSVSPYWHRSVALDVGSALEAVSSFPYYWFALGGYFFDFVLGGYFFVSYCWFALWVCFGLYVWQLFHFAPYLVSVKCRFAHSNYLFAPHSARGWIPNAPIPRPPQPPP